jgi:branched-chain amino acid transport system permease protein
MDYIIHILIMICIYSILGVSFNLILGYTGLIAMCHAAFFGIGAYVAALMSIHFEVNFLWGIVAGMAVAGIIGLLVALPAIRVRDEYLIVTTLALLMIIYTVMMNWLDVTRGAAGLSGIPRPRLFGLTFSSPAQFLPLTVIFGFLCLLISRRIVHSPFGRALKALREDEVAAQALGKNIASFKIRVFAIGGGLAAVAGGLLAHYTTYISPFYFTLTDSIFIFAVVIVGGTANLWGPVVGAFLLVSITEALRFMDISPLIVGFTRQMAYGLILVLFMCFRPQGLLGEFGRKTEVDKGDSPEDEGEDSADRPLAISRAEEVFGTLPERTDATNDTLLELDGVSRSFGGIQAVQRCTLSLKEGKITGLIGPNGAGKTTLFNMITGLYPSEGGSIHFENREITNLSAHQTPRIGIGRSFQNLRLFHRMTVLDNVLVACPNQMGERIWGAFFRFRRVKEEETANRERAMSYLRFVGLEEKAHEIAEDLSFAEQKLLSFARLLATEAKLMLLDEPASGLDPVFMESLYPLIKELVRYGKTVCIVEHNMDVIRAIVDEVVFMDQGQILAKGSPDEIMNTPELTEIYFGL